MKIPHVNTLMKPEWAEAVKEQIMSGYVGCGNKVAEFEDALREHLGIKYVICTSSGTAALHIAAKVLGLTPYDKVIVPSYGWIATANAFAWLGCQVEFAHIDPHTACIDCLKLEETLQKEKNIRAICYVDFNGSCRDGPLIRTIADKYHIPLIEDSCSALGHELGSNHAGSFGDIGVLSFSAPKLITTGQGGAILTDDVSMAIRALAIRNQGHRPDIYKRFTVLGNNFKMSDINAALGLAQLSDIDEILNLKASSVLKLDKILNLELTTTGVPFYNIKMGCDYDYSSYDISLELEKAGIEVLFGRHRHIPDYPIYSNTNFKDEEAIGWQNEAIYLPFGNGLTIEQAEIISETFNRVLEECSI